jgi:hypothetical protein
MTRGGYLAGKKLIARCGFPYWLALGSTQRRWTNLNAAHFSTFDCFFSFDVNQKNYYKFFSVVEE